MKNAELGGGLLVDVGHGKTGTRPRWTCTLRALASIAPQWFIVPEATSRTIAWLAEQSSDTREQLDGLSRRVSAQHQKMIAIARAIVPLAPGRAS